MALERLERSVDRFAFTAYIRPLRPVTWDTSARHAVLGCPDETHARWTVEHHARAIVDALGPGWSAELVACKQPDPRRSTDDADRSQQNPPHRPELELADRPADRPELELADRPDRGGVDHATELRVLAAVTAHWSSTPEVACRAVRGRESLATAGILTALEQRGLVEARRPPKGHMQWRLTERGAAEPRDLPAEVAASRRGE
jgi:hypothetical protein